MTTIRPSRDEDVAAITAIYAHHVLHGTGTFETEPPTAADMAARRADVLSKNLPYLVAERTASCSASPTATGSSPAPPTAFRPRIRSTWPKPRAARAWARSCWPRWRRPPKPPACAS